MNNKNNDKIGGRDYNIFRPELSQDRALSAYKRIIAILPDFRIGESITLAELEKYLFKRYKAEKADWKDINNCTKTKVKRYNKYCTTVFCVSECHVPDEEYHSSYIIRRNNCIDPVMNSDDYFYDLFLIVGSEDKKHLSSYFIGGTSEGFAEEMYLLCGNK